MSREKNTQRLKTMKNGASEHEWKSFPTLFLKFSLKILETNIRKNGTVTYYDLLHAILQSILENALFE